MLKMKRPFTNFLKCITESAADVKELAGITLLRRNPSLKKQKQKRGILQEQEDGGEGWPNGDHHGAVQDEMYCAFRKIPVNQMEG